MIAVNERNATIWAVVRGIFAAASSPEPHAALRLTLVGLL